MNRSVRALSVLVVCVTGWATAADVLPQPAPPFAGKIEINAKDSTPAWPQPLQAPRGAPNILLILLDDFGFSDASTFGGVAQTPNLDKLAARGLRYNNFHTAGVCAPTRAALLSGRNQHRLGFGLFPETPASTPGYDTLWTPNTASIAEVLRLNGYSTAAFGKWHNTPYREITPVGPFDRWPTGLGFEHFYGFLRGAQSHWEPATLYRNTTAAEPKTTPAQGYHLTTDLVDAAIAWLQTHDSLTEQKPYFLYFAPGAVHFPHHVAQQWIDKYRGKFSMGWDRLREETFARQKRLGVIPKDAKLTVRPQEIPAWSALSADEKKLYERAMEVYAGFVEHTDQEVGRLIEAVQRGAHGDNTLILYIVGDNGGSAGEQVPGTVAERLRDIDRLGGTQFINGIPVGWAWAGSTPFQWVKGIASHFGALRNPLIVSWPSKISDRGGLRTQFAHVNDVAATVYEATGIAFPEVVNGSKQQPLDGVSFAWTFEDASTPSKPRVQYFEVNGNRGIYQDGWVASARHADSSSKDFSSDRWELYHVAEDYSQSRDLAAQLPGKLRALQAVFDAQARENNVYPLGGAGPWYTSPLESGKFVYRPGYPRTLALNAPLFSKPHRITAEIDVSEAGAQGALISYGSRWGGFVIYAKDGRMVHEMKASGQPASLITSNIPLPRGRVEVIYEFLLQGESGLGRLYFDRQLVGEGKRDKVDWWGPFWGSFSIGQALGPVPSDVIEPPFAFNGALQQLTVELE